MAGVAVERRTAVIEYGTAECRLGYAGPSNMPAAVVPTLIGRARGVELTATEKAEAAMAALAGIKRSKASIWVGDDLFQKAATLDVSCPITAGRITDWEGLEDMWDALLGREDVGVTPTESAVVLVEPPKIVRQDREMILRLLFEEFGFKAVYLANSAVLSGYANNMTSGTVVSLGDSQGCIVPILEAHVKRHRIIPTNLCGSVLTTAVQFEYSKRETGVKLNALQAKSMKESLCFVSQDIAADVATSAAGPSLEQTFALPDGKLVILSAERFQAPELLFAPDRPDFWALPAVSKPVPNSLQADVLKCFRGWKSDEARSDLQRSVLVTGGCAGLRGICSRLQSELDILNDSGLPLKVVPSKYGGTLDAWVGASMVSQLRGFEDLCITRAQYDEVGSDIAHRKCL